MLGTLIETITENGEYNRTPQPQDGVDGWNDIRLTVDVRILITSFSYTGSSFPISSMSFADDSVTVTLSTHYSFLLYISPSGSLTFFDSFISTLPYVATVPPGHYYLSASYPSTSTSPNDFILLTSSGSIVLSHRYSGSDQFTLDLPPRFFQFDFPSQS